MLKEKLLEYKRKKQNNWTSPSKPQKRIKEPRRSSRKSGKNYLQKSAKKSKEKPTRFANYYDHVSSRNEQEVSDFLPKSTKFDLYMNRDEGQYGQSDFELTGLEAQIIRSAFEDTQKEKIKSYYEKGLGDYGMEGDVLPIEERGERAQKRNQTNQIFVSNEFENLKHREENIENKADIANVNETEVTSAYIKKLKQKLENWHQESNQILNGQLAISKKLVANELNSKKLFFTNQRGNKLDVKLSSTSENFKKNYLRKKNYESELDQYRNQNQESRSQNVQQRTLNAPRLIKQVRPSSRIQQRRTKRSKSMVFERLTQIQESKAQRLMRMREEYKDKEMEGCTFRPNLHKSKHKGKRKISRIRNEKNLKHEREISKNKRKSKSVKNEKNFKREGVGSRLFDEAQKKEERMQKRRQEKEEKEWKQIQNNLKKGRSKYVFNKKKIYIKH